jgi:glycosyltransferase involved in cell wall biosynthesis
MSDVTLVISVYDKCRELDLIFHALKVQDYSSSKFEIIIAEDGENKKISELIERWQSKRLLNIRHITQEDKGFRKNKILNKAILTAATPYLIFIDGDCIPHPEFISAHISNVEPNTVLCGRRVNLTEKISSKLTEDSITSLQYQKTSLGNVLFSALNRDKPGFGYNAEEGFIIKSESARKILMNKDEHILGCNFSIHKEMLEKINGFDENYEGPGLGEDSDIEYRLRLTGAMFKSVRNLAIVYHLYHPKTIEHQENMEYFKRVRSQSDFFCKNGLVKN